MPARRRHLRWVDGAAALPLRASPETLKHVASPASPSTTPPVAPTPSSSARWPTPSATAAPTTRASTLTAASALAHRALRHRPLARRPPADGQRNGTVWIAFNGEVYNFRALRAGLENKHTFAPTPTPRCSSTSTRARPAMVERLDGMFAFALWDARRRRLVLARAPSASSPHLAFDRRARLAFGSSSSPSSLAEPSPASLDRATLSDFFDLAWIPRPTVWARRQLQPAPSGARPRRLAPPRAATGADLPRARRGPLARRLGRRRVSDALDRSVREQMVADVPLGAFLSGGIGSTLVTLAASRAPPSGGA